MKLLFDIGVGKRVEDHFSLMGLDVLAIRSFNPSMPDNEILQLAQLENRIIVTMDKDFGDLIYHATMFQYNPGVILLRMEDANTLQKIEVLESIFNTVNENDLSGHFSVYKKDQLRIRK